MLWGSDEKKGQNILCGKARIVRVLKILKKERGVRIQESKEMEEIFSVICVWKTQNWKVQSCTREKGESE